MSMNRGSRGRFLRACSILAIGSGTLLASTAARAACDPDPTLASSTTTCTGTDTDGITVITDATTVSVEAGASVTATSGPAVTVAIDAPETVYLRTGTILVAGTIDGNSSAGIAITDGTLPDGYYGISTEIGINVAEGGSVSGANAITLGPVAGFTSYTRARLDNAGSITGTSGPAIVVSGNYVSIDSIINRTSGTIGGISGAVGTIDNAGLIDGGSSSAIVGTGYSVAYPSGISNSGHIVSSSATSTIYDAGSEITNGAEIANSGSGSAISASDNSFLSVVNLAGGEITSTQGSTLAGGYSIMLDNSGTIANLGTGEALSSSGISVRNNAGGTISASATAISASEYLNLVNEGTITGDVLAGSTGTYYSASSVNSTGGTIVGNLVFGAGNDTLHAIYNDFGNLVTGVTGTIDGGAGTDSVQIRFDEDRTLNTGVALPTNFEKLALDLADQVSVTLADGFAGPGAIGVVGGGTVRNETTLSADGTVISGQGPGYASLVNAGIVTSTGSSGDYAINGGFSAFTNSGTITSQGAGVAVTTGVFDNSGTISAVGTGANVLLSGVSFSNSGTIRSTGETGLVLSGSSYSSDVPINSGTIEGRSVGVILSASLANTGRISSSGVAVSLDSYGRLDNRAGGAINGGTAAIALANDWSIFNAVITNAGTINGDVSFVGAYSSPSDNNRYFALAGGILNGNLTLGQGSYLVTEIDNQGDGEFAGINGTVTATNSYLRYEVREDTSAKLTLPEGFVSVGYQFHDDAALTLTADETFKAPLDFSGTGSVDLTADIDATNTYAILSASMLSGAGYSSSGNALNIVSHGTITSIRDNANSYASAAVILGAEDHFTNAGTISQSDTSGITYNTISAISGGSVINTGTISVDGGDGLTSFVALDNSGTISTSGRAVYTYLSAAIVNSGTIASTGAAAIVSDNGYAFTIDNRSGGTISGGAGTAIQSGGGTLRNAGSIIGDVDLGYSSYGYSAMNGIYYSDGGTIEGDLRFGSGNDLLIWSGSGVTGTIDGGAGTDTVGHVRSTSGSVTLGGALPTGFEAEFAGSVGSDTVVTIVSDAAFTSDILVAGNGQIINQTATNGMLVGYQNFPTLPEDLAGPLASLGNEANIGGGIDLAVNALSNSAVVGSDTLATMAVYQRATGTLAFSNDGTIASADNVVAAHINGTELASANITNNGTIRGGSVKVDFGFDANAVAPSLAFTNSGTIATASGLTLAPDYTLGQPASFNLALDNSGTLSASSGGATALNVQGGGVAGIAIVNSGTIRSEGDGYRTTYYSWVALPDFPYYEIFAQPVTVASTAVMLYGGSGSSPTSFVNSGTIGVQGDIATALRAGGALDLVNSGRIEGTAGYIVADDDLSAQSFGITRFAGAVQTFGNQADRIVNSGTIIGSIDLGGGNDNIVNTGSISGDVFLGAGDDRFVQGISATLENTVYGDDGTDTVTIDLTGGGTLDAAVFAPFSGFEAFGVTGTGSISVNGILPVQTLRVDAGAVFELQAGSTLQTLGTVALTGSDGSERVINRGTIIGDVMLGGGGDAFEAYANSSVTGVVDAGGGADRLAFHLDGAASSPVPINLDPYVGFEQFALESGIGSLANLVSFDTISVNGGRLIGLAGSTINAQGGITVARGATFGSAGTVNGNLVVDGTLSPGASPATMLVNGNVTLKTGSTTLFEMTPTVSDALVIDGNLTIATDSTLQIVGERPLTPGVIYHLITTTGGIFGTFSAIDKAQSVLGYIVQTPDSLDLLGTLQLRGGATRPVAATTAYINDLLIGGTASAGLMLLLPEFTDAGGYVDASRIGTLHPEAYATASQIGIDNGLSISSALRVAHRINEGADPGFFMLGQGLGSWQNLRADADRGTARVNQNSGGFFGGVGYQTGGVAVSAFAGRIYANQNMAALEARTEADGTFAGASVSFAQGGFDLGGAVIWDGSSATTHRALFDGSKVDGHYDLHTLTFDAHGGYGFAIGDSGWRLGPNLGLTHIGVKRGETQESGNTVLGLNVASRKQDVTFLSADIRLDMAATEQLRPWLTAGWRRRIGGDASLATAGFIGVTGQFTVAGANQERDYAQVSGGLDWAVTPGVTLFAQGGSALTASNGATNINGGIRLDL